MGKISEYPFRLSFIFAAFLCFGISIPKAHGSVPYQSLERSQASQSKMTLALAGANGDDSTDETDANATGNSSDDNNPDGKKPEMNFFQVLITPWLLLYLLLPCLIIGYLIAYLAAHIAYQDGNPLSSISAAKIGLFWGVFLIFVSLGVSWAFCGDWPEKLIQGWTLPHLITLVVAFGILVLILLPSLFRHRASN